MRWPTLRQTFGLVVLLTAVAVIGLTSRDEEALRPFPLPPGMSSGVDSDTPTVPPTGARTVSPSAEPTTPLPTAEFVQTPGSVETPTPVPESVSTQSVKTPCSKPNRRCTPCTPDPGPTHPKRGRCPPTSTAE